MTDHDFGRTVSPAEPWTGDVILELRNGRDWKTGSLEVGVHRDTLRVGHGGHTLAVVDRTAFRAWLIHPSVPFEVDDVIWSTSVGITCLDLRYAHYTIDPASLAILLRVI